MTGWVDLAGRNGRGRPLDHPGNDVGERLRVLHVTVSFDWHEANPKLRHRKDKVYPREDIARHVTYRTALNHEHVRRDRRGEVATAVARFVYQALSSDDWPEGKRVVGGQQRPGG